jgi:hypothetical protein
MRYLMATVLALAWLGTAGAAEIYCTTQQSRDCSDRPSPGSIAVRVTAPRNTAAAPAPARTPAGSVATSSGGDPVAEQRAQNAAVAKAREGMQKDLADKRTEQCKKNQEIYQKSIEARLIYRAGKNGEREYLSDTEADQARLNARINMEQTCGK